MDTFVGRSDNQIRSYWAMLIFSSKGQPPKEVESYTDMLNLISSNPELIGYIPTSLVSSQVRAVIEFER